MNKKKAIIIAIAAAAVLTAVILLLVLLPKGGAGDKEATVDEGVALSRSTNAQGLHEAQVQTDANGNIANNSYGTLMEYYPADIREIHIENAKGTMDVISSTPEGEATVYSIKGYEDYDLQSGNPDLIASAAANLSFTKVVTMDKDKGADYGFDKPRSTVTVSYTDNTKAIIIVGNDAPQQAGTYIKFGTGDTVYVANTETVSAFDYGLTDLISLAINDAADNTDNNAASEITLSGSAFPQEVVLEPNDNENYSNSYKMTAPSKRLANESESSLVTGAVRGMYASAVKMVAPSEEQRRELGLTAPYAALTAVYPDVTVQLTASKPDKDGNVYLMADGKNVVYTVEADKVPWVKTGFEKLCAEYVCNPKMTELTDMTVKADGKTYDFTLESKESVTTDDDGVETASTVTEVSCGGKEIEIGSFSNFFNDIALMAPSDVKTGSGSGSEALSVTYTFADGSSDSVSFVPEGDLYLAKLNGEAVGHCAKADVMRAVKSVAEVVR